MPPPMQGPADSLAPPPPFPQPTLSAPCSPIKANYPSPPVTYTTMEGFPLTMAVPPTAYGLPLAVGAVGQTAFQNSMFTHAQTFANTVANTVALAASKSPSENSNEFEFGLMELVWHGEFNSRFLTFGPHRWHLIPVEKPPGETAATLWPSDLYLPNVPWRTFRDSAKVRFCCDSCGNGWTSMKGRVIFWFYQDPKDMQGYVLFKLYGQQCKRCANGQFEHAMWYPDEVVKVIENMYNRVGQVYYSFYRPPIRIERRSGKPREQHNSELCQACKEGLCQEELMFT